MMILYLCYPSVYTPFIIPFILSGYIVTISRAGRADTHTQYYISNIYILHKRNISIIIQDKIP